MMILGRFMKFENCLRCGSSKLEEGRIFQYYQRHPAEPMRVHWKIAPHIRAQSAPLAVIICKSCGHVELAIESHAFIDLTRYQCPHCKAIYYYRLDPEDDLHIVECQNCGEDFEVEEPGENEDFLDAIEKDLE